MTDPVVILIPVLNRPGNVAPLLDSIERSTPSEWRALFIVDPDDTDERDAIDAADGEELVYGGSYARKINQGVRETSEPLLFLGADDLYFHPGWLEHAARHLSDTVGVVGTNDLGNRQVIKGRHATHSLVARWYTALGTIDDPNAGTLLHEGYHHNFVDNEFVDTAKHRDAWAFARDSHVEHLHPNWGKAESDATYRRGMRRYERDRQLHARRRELWT